MNNLILIGVGIGICIVLAILFGRRRPSLTDPQPRKTVEITRNQPPKRKRRFYGVSIKAGVCTCDAVDLIRNQRFLVEDAPKFPLPASNREDCRCVAIPEDDRRADFGRRNNAFSAYGDYNPNAYSEKRENVNRDRREVETAS